MRAKRLFAVICCHFYQVDMRFHDKNFTNPEIFMKWFIFVYIQFLQYETEKVGLFIVLEWATPNSKTPQVLLLKFKTQWSSSLNVWIFEKLELDKTWKAWNILGKTWETRL